MMPNGQSDGDALDSQARGIVPLAMPAVPVFEGNDILSVWFGECLVHCVAPYSEPMSRDEMLRTAPVPEGPWSGPIRLFRAWRPRNRLGWVYDTLAHLEFVGTAECEIYVT